MKNDLIQFKQNGFIYQNIFYTYKSINYIDTIKRVELNDYLNEKLGCCSVHQARAVLKYYFIIKLTNNQNIAIGYEYSVKLYNAIERKNKILKFLFGKYKFVRNKQLDNFYKTKTDVMKKDIKNLKLIRKTLINKINNSSNNRMTENEKRQIELQNIDYSVVQLVLDSLKKDYEKLKITYEKESKRLSIALNFINKINQEFQANQTLNIDNYLKLTDQFTKEYSDVDK